MMIVRLSFILMAVMTVAASGCGGPVDMTDARLKAMPYTIQNIAEEAASRLRSQKANPGAAKRKGAPGGDEGRGQSSEADGPGGDPFSIDAIAADLLSKLERLEEGGVTEQVERLDTRLKEYPELPSDDREALMKVLRELVQKRSVGT